MENTRPEISLIIPAYNEEKVIGNTIHSIRDATDSEVTEIIIVCNGCTDNTETVARDAGASRIIIAPEKGASKASNLGAKNAEGDTLAFLDADTSIAHNLLQEVRRAVAQNCIGGRTVVKWEGNGIMPRLFSLVSYIHPYKWGGFCFVDKEVFESMGATTMELMVSTLTLHIEFPRKAKQHLYAIATYSPHREDLRMKDGSNMYGLQQSVTTLIT